MSNFENPKFIQFLFQVTLLFIVSIVSIVNLTLGTPHYEVWLFLLSTSLGVVVPQPKIKTVKETLLTPSLMSTGLSYSAPPPPPMEDNDTTSVVSHTHRITIDEEETGGPRKRVASKRIKDGPLLSSKIPTEDNDTPSPAAFSKVSIDGDTRKTV